MLLRQGRSRSLVEAAVFVESHGQAGVAFAGVLVEGLQEGWICEDVAGGVIFFRKVDVSSRRDLLDFGDIARQGYIHERGGDKDEVVAYANELGLSDCVFFTSPQYDRSVIRAWYCRGDLFLFPSTFDTNGLVVREAAACELASVLVRGSCAAEDITDGRNGFLIEENADSMAALLAKLCHEPEVLKRVGRQAQEEIYISWDDAVHRAQQRYEIVIEQYRSGGHSARRRFSDEYYQSLGLCVDVLKRSREHLREQWDAFAEHFQ